MMKRILTTGIKGSLDGLRFIFVFFFVITAMYTLTEILILIAWFMGIIPWSSAVMHAISANALMSPLTISILLFRPHFEIVKVKEENIAGLDDKPSFYEILKKSSKDLPSWLKKTLFWVADTFIFAAEFNFIAKKLAIALYDKYYTLRFRLVYGAICVAMMAYTLPQVQKIFVH